MEELGQERPGMAAIGSYIKQEKNGGQSMT